MKAEIRTLGIDDGSFDKFDKEQKKICLVGVVMRGNSVMEGVLTKSVEIDGDDATKTITSMVNTTKHRDQLRAVLTDGITVAGLNVIDISHVSRKTGLPIIVVSRKLPDLEKMDEALKHVKDSKKRSGLLRKAGPMYKMETPKVNFQCRGCDEKRAREIIRVTVNRSVLPEPIRLAHLIATGISRGESVGRP
jgi:endonuclease V-like protein UPF0215 family